MLFRFAVCSAITLALGPAAVVASSSGALDREYEQVRKIAMRDPGVRRAFQKADERLESKIVQIDPSLKGYKPGQPRKAGNVPEKAATAPSRNLQTGRPAPQASKERTHVVARGETLSVIAFRHKITVNALKTANPDADEKKLRVGQRLAIPSNSHRVSKPGAEAPGLWDWLKNKF